MSDTLFTSCRLVESEQHDNGLKFVPVYMPLYHQQLNNIQLTIFDDNTMQIPKF